MTHPPDIVGYHGMSVDYRAGVNDVTSEPENPDVDDGARTGICAGGPLHGQELTSRYPKGTLVCDRPAAELWIYDWDGEAFVSRSGSSPLPLVDDETAPDNRWRAANEGDYDVIAAPWAGGDADEVDAYAGDDQADDEQTEG